MKKIDWKKMGGLVPAVVQNARNGTVLMLGYMNKEALQKTISTKYVWFYSRSKKRLWRKGEESGNCLKLVDIRRDIKIDCDGDAILLKVVPEGSTCHTGKMSCFGEDGFLDDQFLALFQIIQNRKKMMPKKSYTASLFRKGLDSICLKVAEEALEVIQAAKKESKKRLVEESVDLLYHFFVLLVEEKVDLSEIFKVIKQRNS